MSYYFTFHCFQIELCSSIPPLSAILSNTAHLSETQIELLHWALQPKTFTLQTCPADSVRTCTIYFHKICTPFCFAKSFCLVIISNMVTVWCSYNAVSFLKNPHKRYTIAHTLGWGMICLCGFTLWFIFCLGNCSHVCSTFVSCYWYWTVF